MVHLEYEVEVWQSGDYIMAGVPGLDVTSYGPTEEEATANLREAVGLFVEECARMGTLEEVLEEAGFSRSAGQPIVWSRPILSRELHTLEAPV